MAIYYRTCSKNFSVYDNTHTFSIFSMYSSFAQYNFYVVIQETIIDIIQFGNSCAPFVCVCVLLFLLILFMLLSCNFILFSPQYHRNKENSKEWIFMELWLSTVVVVVSLLLPDSSSLNDEAQKGKVDGKRNPFW